MIKIFTEEQEDFLENEERHPAIWTILYMIFALYFLKWISKSIYEFGKKQETVNRMYIKYGLSQQWNF